MYTSENISLLYDHPHVAMYVTDNTVYTEEQPEVETPTFNGIQVGFFGAGRDNTLLYCKQTSEQINEFGRLDYKLYGQAGYNAYNALDSGNAGMYILNLKPEDATISNIVIMSKYKLVEDTPDENLVLGDDSMQLAEAGPIKEMIPNDDAGAGVNAFELSGEIVSGIPDEPHNVRELFSHITTEFISGNNLGNFTIATVKIPVPTGIIVGENVTITQTSAALKKFYADFGEDTDHIVANTDNVTATKTRIYSAEDVLEGNDYITLSFIVSEFDTIHIDVDWSESDKSEFAIKTTGLNFVAEIEDTNPVMKLGIMYEATHIEGATSVSKLKSEIAKLYSDEPDADGYYKAPLMWFWSLGRGSYGGNLRAKFTDANEYEGSIEPTTRVYQMTVMENTKEGLKDREYLEGVFDEDAFDDYDGASLFIQDILNDMEQGSGKINMGFNSVVLEDMIEKVNSTIEDESEYETVTTFDPIFGRTVTGEQSEHVILLDNQNEDGYVNLVAADGFGLVAGNDGSIDPTLHTEEEIAETKEALLIKAFEGTIDKRINSRYSAPADFCLDANFPANVKAAMAGFAKRRKYDCMTYLDTGLLKTPQECIQFLKSIARLTNNNIVKEMHCYTYRDKKFTGKTCEMSITHWFAKALPNHVKNYGIGEPFAKERARISTPDFLSGSFYPVIDPTDHDIKAQIYKYGANCFETVKYNVYQRSTAITTYELRSDRKDEFNEYITQKAVKIAHDLLSSKIYKIAEDEDRIKFTEAANRVLDVELSGLVKSCTVAFEMTNKDKQKGILRLKLRLTFKTVAKYGICQVYLDPRVIEDSLAA